MEGKRLRSEFDVRVDVEKSLVEPRSGAARSFGGAFGNSAIDDGGVPGKDGYDEGFET